MKKVFLAFIVLVDNRKNTFFDLGIYPGDVRDIGEPFSRHRV
jgi:hypothetical protein